MTIIPNLTLFIQLFFFLTSVWICSKFLFPPVMEVLDRRRKMIEGAKAELRRHEEEGEEMARTYAERIRKARAKGQEERNRFRNQGSQKERVLLESAREEASKILYEGQKQAEMIREKSLEQLDREVKQMAQMIAERTLGRPLES